MVLSLRINLSKWEELSGIISVYRGLKINQVGHLLLMARRSRTLNNADIVAGMLLVKSEAGFKEAFV